MNGINNKLILSGFKGAFYQSGIEIVNYDPDKVILTCTLPEDSYEYHLEDVQIHNPDDYIRSIKQKLIDVIGFPSQLKIRYKTRPIYWTKEMSDKNLQNHINEL